MCADAPDTSGINAAAQANADIAKEALQWYKSQAAKAEPLIQRAADRADQISLAQLDSMNTNTRLASDYDQYRRDTFQPLEKSIVQDAQEFDTEAKREELAGLARTDTAQAFDAARSQLRRQVGAAGGSVADPAYTIGLSNLSATEALADASSRNKARADARTVGRAMKMDAAALGRNLPSQQATSAQIALSAGNSAAATGAQPVALAQQGAAMGGQGYQTAIGANQSAGNLYGQAAQIQSSGNSSGIWGAAGNVLGSFAGSKAGSEYLASMITSDENEKTDIKPVDDEVSLAAVRKVPVKQWRYRSDSAAADGGRQHTGPMAQDVEIALGSRVAPEGKKIDPISLVGTTLSAVRALDKRVIALERSVEDHA